MAKRKPVPSALEQLFDTESKVNGEMLEITVSDLRNPGSKRGASIVIKDKAVMNAAEVIVDLALEELEYGFYGEKLAELRLETLLSQVFDQAIPQAK